MKILVANQAVDFRKGIDGLVRICRECLQSDPFSGTLFIFRNKKQTGIKILVYDGQGFWLCHKRISKGRFTWWPSIKSGKTSGALFSHELQVLLSAGNPLQTHCPESWREIT